MKLIVSIMRETLISVAAHDEHGRFVGRLTWYAEGLESTVHGDLSFQIASLYVRSDARRQGIATALFKFAQEREPRVRHSDQLTPDGAKFVRAIEADRKTAREQNMASQCSEIELPRSWDGAVGHTRVYTSPTARVAHLKPDWLSGDAVLCPAESRLFTGWLGTGNQAEYERAAALPTCKRCEKARDGA